MSETPRKLTRQERRTALVAYDEAIASCERLYDRTGDAHWRFRANEAQQQRADALDRLENNPPAP